jgi:hypothetical protein
MIATNYEGESDQATLASQTDVNDTSTLTDSVAVQSGSTVTLYTTVNETYTTEDTSTGTEIDQPGASSDDAAFVFNVSGSNVSFLRAGTEDTLLEPLTEQSTDTAVDADGLAALGSDPDPTLSDASTGESSDLQLADKSSTAGSVPGAQIVTVSSSGSSSKVSLSGVAAWAEGHWNRSYNGFSPDCTDFVSRSLHFGGHQPFYTSKKALGHNIYDPNAWYDTTLVIPFVGRKNILYTQDWGEARYQAKFEQTHGGTVQTTTQGVEPGWVAYADFKGGSWSSLDHAAIVTRVIKSNIFVAQHSGPEEYEPIYRVKGKRTWTGVFPALAVWFLNPTKV